MSNISHDKKEFRTLVLSLKNLNPSWTVPRIATFIEQSENHPLLKRRQLLTKIRRTLKRNTIDDRPRSGRPITVSTTTFKQTIKASMKLRKGASVRNVTSNLNRNGTKCSTQTVYNTARKLNLKWFRMKKSQKLTDNNKDQRVICAKQLRRKYGVRKNAKKWKWNRVVNTDFSGKYTLQPFRNKRNDGIWAEADERIPPSLINAPFDKFEKGVIFWGAISSLGLIPSRAPINFSKWLQQQQVKKNKKVYLTGNLYAKFLKEKAAPVIKRVFNNTGLTPIFQDDQDTKHRTPTVKEIVGSLFDERIDPKIGDAKLADIWPIENVWGAIKEKIRGQEFDNELELEREIGQQWKMFTPDKCRRMIERIPHRLKLLIDQDGEQIHKH